MLQASIQLYRNAYSGISKPVWWLSFVMLVNRSGTMVIPFLTVYLTQKGYTLTEAGIVMACFGVGAIAGGYLGGRLTDSFGFYHVQVFSLLLMGYCSLYLAICKVYGKLEVVSFSWQVLVKHLDRQMQQPLLFIAMIVTAPGAIL